MGSSKRHKTDKSRESKKKRHRSRSRSHSLERIEKHRHHKKHKRKDRKDYDSDVEIIGAPPPPKISRSGIATPPPPEISTKLRSPTPPKGGASQLSLSIEETNRIRAKLGLKPLEVDNTPKDSGRDDSSIIKDDLGEFYHKPAPNINDKVKSQKIKDKLSTLKQKRQLEDSLSKIRTLGESDSDDDAKAWVKKSKTLQIEKKKAEERAKMLDQLDEEFGIGNLVQEEIKSDRRKAYLERDLKGLKVEHNLDSFQEGTTTILTLKDQEVLAENGDILVNVNMLDNEHYHRNIICKKKKPGYDAYDDSHYDEHGMSLGKVLEKYDEEIDGQKKESFALGSINAKEMKERRAEMVRNRLANKRLETLQVPQPKLVSEYFNEQELTQFKKTKKKVRKIRSKKMLKADDIIPDSNDYLRDLGSRRRRRPDEYPKEDVLDVDDVEAPKEDFTGLKIEEDDREFEMHLALKKARKMKPKATNTITNIKPESTPAEPGPSGFITLNSTAEFCRTLGDIPTYGLAGNREDNDQELMDFQMDDVKEEPIDEDSEANGRGAWNTVKLDQTKSEPVAMEAAILDAEPSLGQGVGGALQLAMSKGYLQKEDMNRPSASRFAHLQAQNYSIEDKTYGDDEKFGRRDRFNGPTSDFKEKDGFKPNVKLEYIDDDGHVLSAKEAFRYLSHKFHGKGPGKNKMEKRMKKVEQEVLMKKMSSTDTPLGTLTLLQAKQKETQSPYIVLSGSKHIQTTSISKSKH